MTTIDTLSKKRAAAEEAFAKAKADLTAAEERAYRDAEQRRADAEAEAANNYNAAGDLDAIRAAGDRLTAAILNSELGSALLEYATANQRAYVRHQRATGYVGLGLIEPDRVSGQFRFLDTAGDQVTRGATFSELFSNAITDVIARLAEETISAEETAVQQRISDAYNAEPVNPPTHWRITGPGGTRTDNIGGREIRFINGTTYLPADSPLVDYYQRGQAYTVAPAHQVPTDWDPDSL